MRCLAVLVVVLVVCGDAYAGEPPPCALPDVAHPFTERARFLVELEALRATLEAGREAAEVERTGRLVDRATYLARIAEYRRAIAAYREGLAQARASACRWIGNQILAVRVDEMDPPAADRVIVRVTYYYTGNRGEGMGMEAITFMHGESTGHWAYRPAKVAHGLNVARIELGMNQQAPDYESNELLIGFFVPGGAVFDERMVPFERAWTRQ